MIIRQSGRNQDQAVLKSVPEMKPSNETVTASGRSPAPFTPEMLAERWGCTRAHVIKLIKNGDIRSFRVGSLYRVSAPALQEYEMTQGMAPAIDAAPEPGFEGRCQAALAHAKALVAILEEMAPGETKSTFDEGLQRLLNSTKRRPKQT